MADSSEWSSESFMRFVDGPPAEPPFLTDLPRATMGRTAPMTLTDFLLARIAEDEKAAKQGRAIDDPLPNTYGVFEHERVLAECEAKRWIAERARDWWGTYLEDNSDQYVEGGWGAFEDAAKHLAAVYSDHPDYREEWRP